MYASESTDLYAVERKGEVSDVVKESKCDLC